MPHIFSYRDEDIYCHHTVDPHPDPEAFSMHAHERMEVFYFISGRGSYLVEGTAYPLQPGDVLIMRPAETHRLAISPDEPYERISFHFAPALLSGLDPEQQLLRPFFDRPLGQGNLYPSSSCGKRLQTAFSDFSFEGIADIRLNLLARLLLLLTSLRGIHDSSDRLFAPAQSPAGELVTYVNEHLFEDISLQTVSAAFFRSKSQISRMFRQATGSSLWEYVTIKRLLAARAMIQRGESTGAACTACGFSDYSAFFRAYRAQFHHAPKEDTVKKL